MVINIGFLKDKRYEEIEEEIRQVHAACDGRILKVIIETCLLTEEEKIKMCEIVTKAGAEFIKTSTGFSTGGATFEDVELMRNRIVCGCRKVCRPWCRPAWNKPVDQDYESRKCLSIVIFPALADKECDRDA